MLLNKSIQQVLGLLVCMGLVMISCGPAEDRDTEQDEPEEEAAPVDPMENKGIGPIDNVELTDEIDEEMVAKGQDIFENKCEACHKMEDRHVGPAVLGVTERRTPEWIMNMILNPSEMLRQDPIAKELFAEYMIEMTYQNVSEDEARAILEYFRYLDEGNDPPS